MPAPMRLTDAHRQGFAAHATRASSLLAQLQALQQQDAEMHRRALAIADEASSLKSAISRHANTAHTQIDVGLVDDHAQVTESEQTLARALQQIVHVAEQGRHDVTSGLRNANLSDATQGITYVLSHSQPEEEASNAHE